MRICRSRLSVNITLRTVCDNKIRVQVANDVKGRKKSVSRLT